MPSCPALAPVRVFQRKARAGCNEEISTDKRASRYHTSGSTAPRKETQGGYSLLTSRFGPPKSAPWFSGRQDTYVPRRGRRPPNADSNWTTSPLGSDRGPFA